MNNNQHSKKTSKTSAWSNLLIIFLIAIIMVVSSIGIFAWSKYTTAIDGTATAQVAKWSFKVVDGVPETTDTIEFAVTRTDTNTTVAADRLAPGTYGQFEIGIDARGTETILEYVIDVALTNKPTNLKFYSDSSKTNELKVASDKLTIKGFMSLEDVNEIRTETIYWDWPYETGTEEEIATNDVIDTQDAAKTVTMAITVTGTEVLEKSTYLADVVQVGDYVNYDASSNGVQTFTSSDCLAGSSISDTISTADDFNSDAVAQWRVLSVDKENGVVELMAADPTAQTVRLSGGDAFVNAETVLNNIGAIYGQGEGATGGRSITIEDVEQYSSYDKTTYSLFGKTETFTSGSFYKEITDGEGNVIGYEETLTTATTDNPVTMTGTFYSYDASKYFSDSTAYNMLFKNSTNTSSYKAYWLASRAYNSSWYIVRIVDSDGCLYEGIVYGALDGDDGWRTGFCPVVSLTSNIQTTGQDENGVWQLKVD